ncbi:hypothetical protein J2Z75_003146 [Rhizobium herbae]|uniref:Uncharacterized protein n=1 Tax=Rhizobium herbae TaxID=508661 RepID=A0ABS4ENV3_9HYPH|nr:hypothetical protein [Rhizobium herbae]
MLLGERAFFIPAVNALEDRWEYGFHVCYRTESYLVGGDCNAIMVFHQNDKD